MLVKKYAAWLKIPIFAGRLENQKL